MHGTIARTGMPDVIQAWTGMPPTIIDKTEPLGIECRQSYGAINGAGLREVFATDDKSLELIRTVRSLPSRDGLRVDALIRAGVPLPSGLAFVTVAEFFVHVNSEATTFIPNDWERYWGNGGVALLDEGDLGQSAWSAFIGDEEANRYFCAFAASANLMFTAVQVSRSGLGVTFKIIADVRSGSGPVKLTSSRPLRLDPVVFLANSDPFSLFDRYAAVVKRANRFRRTRPPRSFAGWSDWYSYYGDNTTQTILDNATAIVERMPECGIRYVQVDDGWQKIKEFTTYPELDLRCTSSSGAPWEHNAGFAPGMKHLARSLRRLGFRPGLWIRPVSLMAESVPVSRGKPWVIEYPHDNPNHGRWLLDLSQKDAHRWLARLIRTVTRRWGFRLIKYDFITLDTLNESNGELPRDFFGTVLASRSTVPSAAYYRNALKTIRRAAAPGTHILACNVLFLSAVGVADSYRTSEDVLSSNWEVTKRALAAVALRHMVNRKLWLNDPDVLMVGTQVQEKHARFWVSLVGLTSNFIMLGDKIWELPEDRLSMLKFVLPPTEVSARPLRPFSTDAPSIWQLPIGKHGLRSTIVGLCNWDSQPTRLSVHLSDLDLDTGQQDRGAGSEGDTDALSTPGSVFAWDLWEHRPVGLRNELQVDLEGDSVAVVVLCRVADAPRFISVDHHLVNGVRACRHSRWNAVRKRLDLRLQPLPTGQHTVVVWVPEALRPDGKNQPKISCSVHMESVELGGPCLQITLMATGRRSIRLALTWNATTNAGGPL